MGKSSLLNRLAGEELAIVTAIPGTTRDSLRQAIHIDGVPLNIVDTAGLRDTQDELSAWVSHALGARSAGRMWCYCWSMRAPA